MINLTGFKEAQNYHDKIIRMLSMNPALDVEDFQTNLVNYCQSRSVSISNTLDYCLQQSAKGEYMPWDQPLN